MRTLEGTTVFHSDTEVFEFVKSKLYVAAVCDILDELGLRQQAMHHRLRPLLPDPKSCGFVGRARTARWMETDYVVDGDPYRLSGIQNAGLRATAENRHRMTETFGQHVRPEAV